MSHSVTHAARPSEVSYLLEARIREINANRLTAVCFGHQDEDSLRPPAAINHYHNPLGEDFCLSELAIGSRAAQ